VVQCFNGCKKSIKVAMQYDPVDGTNASIIGCFHDLTILPVVFELDAEFSSRKGCWKDTMTSDDAFC
jgi:hypothetical protein